MSTLEKISEEPVESWSYSRENSAPSNAFCALVLEKFQQITQYYFLFHAGFCALALVELVSSLILFSFLSKSSLLALLLAALLLTAFTYLVLLFYFQAKKPEQMIELKDTFLELYKKNATDSASLADLIYTMNGQLDQRFYHQEIALKQFPSLQLLMKKFRIWATWRDLHKMKEILLLIIVNEQIEKIKASALDLEAHAALGSAYLALSQLYVPDPHMAWIPPQYSSSKMTQKHHFMASRALEEFKILDTLSPHDLWIHAQLASLYHSLELVHEEIAEYEAMQNIAPQDPLILMRLGTLYFHQGRNAKGLQIYQELNTISETHAHQLLSTYDAYTTLETQFDTV